MNKQAHTAKSPKDSTNRGDWHVANTSLGMGDFYGTGVKNPQGKLRDSWINSPVPARSVGTPPKKMA